MSAATVDAHQVGVKPTQLTSGCSELGRWYCRSFAGRQEDRNHKRDTDTNLMGYLETEWDTILTPTEVASGNAAHVEGEQPSDAARKWSFIHVEGPASRRIMTSWTESAKRRGRGGSTTPSHNSLLAGPGWLISRSAPSHRRHPVSGRQEPSQAAVPHGSRVLQAVGNLHQRVASTAGIHTPDFRRT